MDTYDYYLIIKSAEGDSVASGFIDWIEELRGETKWDSYNDGYDEGYNDGASDGCTCG